MPANLFAPSKFKGQAQQDLKDGMPIQECATKNHISTRTANRYKAELGLVHPQRRRITNLARPSEERIKITFEMTAQALAELIKAIV